MILLTGGTGYIGSHACVRLVEAGCEVLLLDNLSNSSPVVLERIKAITGIKPAFIKGDMRDGELLETLFASHDISAVIHFAGLKAVGESEQKPLEYYDNNIRGTLNLLKVMSRHNVKTMVFSSSATVYGVPEKNPITEDMPRCACNVYGRTKLIIEDMLIDLHKADADWNVVLLRYFNPVGAHKSGLIGEDPNGIPNNLVPFISQVAIKRLEKLFVFGNDYDTPDGTCLRDYIHVLDLVEGHLEALRFVRKGCGLRALNLGTGRGCSVFEMIEAFERACGRSVPYEIAPRRPGDAPICYADPSLAAQTLGWKAKNDISAMCRDVWNWQTKNPEGYGG